VGEADEVREDCSAAGGAEGRGVAGAEGRDGG
jgi:hypothetical protein